MDVRYWTLPSVAKVLAVALLVLTSRWQIPAVVAGEEIKQVDATARQLLQPSFINPYGPFNVPTDFPTPCPHHESVPVLEFTRHPTRHPTRRPTGTRPPITFGPPPTTSVMPTGMPTEEPSVQPSSQPSAAPIHVTPTSTTTNRPTHIPTSHNQEITTPPSRKQLHIPSSQPTSQPSHVFTTHSPTEQPSLMPVAVLPTFPSKHFPTSKPSSHPSSHPSSQPSSEPTQLPTSRPSSKAPTASPSKRPTSPIQVDY